MFWAFMLIMDILIPLTMIVFGIYFMKIAPQKINAVFGYRTNMSMKNRNTWEFAHKYCGKLWFLCGIVLLPVSVFVMLFVIKEEINTIGITGGIVSIVQIITFVCTLFPTEAALKKKFDQHGNRING